MSSTIINSLNNIEDYSYLELGVFNNKNFNQIRCNNKFSVDVNGNAMFTGTTDDYFAQLSNDKIFDIIFIDANHDYEYVLRDYNNSVDRATKWILIHDMIPPSKKYTQSKFCSDSYKLLYYFLTETDLEVYPMNNNFGLTLIKAPAKKIKPDGKFKDLDYSEFMTFLQTQKLYSDSEITLILRKQYV